MARPSLSGRRVLLTRPEAKATAWRTALEQAGAEVIGYPTIRVGPPPSWAELDEAFARLADYDWLVFTSANAAVMACGRLPPSLSRASLDRPRIAAVGRETARALTSLGLPVALVPAREDQDGLIESLQDLPSGARVLFPQAVGGRSDFASALRARGITVDVVPASATIARRDLPPLPRFDTAIFASPSALDAFLQAHGPALLVAGTTVVIGPTTAAAARRHGLDPVVASAPNVDAIITAIHTASSSKGAL